MSSPSYHTDFLANVFDAFPVPALVVDRDVRLIDCNVQAARLIGRTSFARFDSAGRILGCVNSTKSPDGCGHAAGCRTCPIRNCVRQVFETGQTCRRKACVEALQEGRISQMELLVTATPIPGEPEPVALLVLDDAVELSRLLTASPASSSPGSKARAKAHGRRTGNS
ncbi:MAG: hypothetical protein ABSH50_09525 [Bryobacteraceae bacterium]|jgi:hypothetical protein